MKLHSLKPNKGARDKNKFRVGRGMAQGRGKQAGRGQSGQNKRHGHRPGFEGGQTPWFRRLPKIGFNNINHIEYQIVSLAKLDSKYKDGDKIDFKSLLETKLIRNKNLPVKILGTGKITKKIELTVDAASKSAIVAIKIAGGKINII